MRVFRAACCLLAVVLLIGAGAALASGGIPTSLRVTAPSSVPAGSAARFDARLLTADGPVWNRPVLLQRQDPSGWVDVGSMTTASDGLGHTSLAVGSSARFRAYFRGDSSYDESTSPEV